MPIIVIVVVAVLGLPALYVGARSVRRWDDRNDPDYLRDVVHQGVLAFLKIGLLLLLLSMAAIAIIGALAAQRGGVPIPGGVWVCAIISVLISAGFLLAHWRLVNSRD